MQTENQLKKPREKFKFHARWHRFMEGLSSEDKGWMFDGILQYGFYGKIITMPEHLKLALQILKGEIDESLEYEKVSLYVVKLYDNKETFIKIGVAGDIKKRIKAFTAMGYEYIRFEGLEIKFDDREQALSFEKKLHNELSLFQFLPKKKFGGQFECYNEDSYGLICKGIEKIRGEIDNE